MRYQNVCLEALAYTLPDEVLTTTQVEQRLAPLYERLRLPEGRLEMMTGIRERRLWPVGMTISDGAIQSGELAIAMAGIERQKIGCLIHGSVTRDQLEPATACRVHHKLGLSEQCVVYDISNACLGMLNGMLDVANRIELGQIQAGLVVGSENSRPLLEGTIAELNGNASLTRESIKPAIASLTIGSGAAAVLLTHRDISSTQNRLLLGAARAHTRHYELCAGGHHAGGGDTLLMRTDSERLLQEGIATGSATFRDLLAEANWNTESIQRTVCHQVGVAHRKLLLDSLGLPPQRDFATFSWLGNTGSVALPTAMAIGAEEGFFEPGDRIAMLGIGSGINCVMLGVDWQQSPQPQRVARQTLETTR